MKRDKLYNLIKKNNLQDEIKKKFGKNYTNVPTKDLESIVCEEQEEQEEKPIDLRNAVKALLSFLHSVDDSLFDDIH